MRTGATRSHAQALLQRRAWRAWRGPEWSSRTCGAEGGVESGTTLPGLTIADQQGATREKGEVHKHLTHKDQSQSAETGNRIGPCCIQVPLPGRAKEQSDV